MTLIELRILTTLLLNSIDLQKGLQIMSDQQQDQAQQLLDVVTRLSDDITSIQDYVTNDRAARDAVDVQLRADLARALADTAAGKLLETHVNELQAALTAALDKADAAKAALAPPPVVTPPPVVENPPAPPENPPAPTPDPLPEPAPVANPTPDSSAGSVGSSDGSPADPSVEPPAPTPTP